MMLRMFCLRLSKILLILWFMVLTNHPCCHSVTFESPTNLSHIVFGIAGTTGTWSNRRRYVESWWQPNKTRGYVFMDKAPLTEHLPWPSSSPPLRISEDNSRYKDYDRHRTAHAIRTLRVIEETFKADGIRKGEVRWYVIVDDDTLLFLDNLLEVLSKYDHRKYFYIGMNSESVMANLIYSFDMGFGGAGYALSYPLAKAVTKNMEVCIKAYPTLLSSDHMLQSCIADLGISLTKERGFHQVNNLSYIYIYIVMA